MLGSIVDALMVEFAVRLRYKLYVLGGTFKSNLVHWGVSIPIKVEKILKGSLVSIPSPSVKTNE